MLFGSSEKRHLLLVSKEDVSYIERLDWPLITIAVNLLVTGIFFCFIGIYGYACSSPYPLFTVSFLSFSKCDIAFLVCNDRNLGNNFCRILGLSCCFYKRLH